MKEKTFREHGMLRGLGALALAAALGAGAAIAGEPGAGETPGDAAQPQGAAAAASGVGAGSAPQLSEEERFARMWKTFNDLYGKSSPAPNELRIDAPTGVAVKPLNGVGAGPQTGWGLAPGGGVYIDATPLYRKLAPPLVRLHDVETPFGRGRFFDVHVFMDDKSFMHARYFADSDAYVDSILAAAPNAKIIFRLGESIGVDDKLNPYAVRPADRAAWCAAAVAIAKHYVEKYPAVEWWFEVWNEANLTGNDCHKTFASAPNAGDTCPAADYFALYEDAALALGRLRDAGGHGNMKIGGPAASGIEKGGWSTFSCKEFLDELERCNAERGCVVPLDFYSWHQYDGPGAVKATADEVGRLLAATTHYRKTLNVCDEWNLSCDPQKIPAIAAAEGGASALATMIALQGSALDAAAYYDAQLCGAFNGLWHKPYFDVITAPAAQQKLLAAFQARGMAGVDAAERQMLAPHAGKPVVPLSGYWAMRFFARLSSLGEVVRVKRGADVPSTVYALAARRGTAAAIAIANCSPQTVSLRVGGWPSFGPGARVVVAGGERFAPAKVTIEHADCDGTMGLPLGPYGIGLVEFRDVAVVGEAMRYVE